MNISKYQKNKELELQKLHGNIARVKCVKEECGQEIVIKTYMFMEDWIIDYLDDLLNLSDLAKTEQAREFLVDGYLDELKALSVRTMEERL